MDTTTFLSLLRQAVQVVFPQANLRVSIIRTTRLKARIELSKTEYVDVFFREETRRVDYALIVAGARIFGLDNLKEWHCHPLDDPNQHIPCPEPTPDEALEQIRQALQTTKGNASS
ncbi:MAG: hypothetical protein U9R15_03305 [Chloroflexota bacterium]|nr:hypothetical protein [Chloroflexota bacterium]